MITLSHGLHQPLPSKGVSFAPIGSASASLGPLRVLEELEEQELPARVPVVKLICRRRSYGLSMATH